MIGGVVYSLSRHIKYNSGGSGTVPAGLSQGETEGFYLSYDTTVMHIVPMHMNVCTVI